MPIDAYSWEHCPWPGNCWLKRHIFTEQKGWETKHFSNNMLWKLKFHKIKVDLK